MQKWEIDFVLISHGDEKTAEILCAKGAEGWEPYAVIGITHYFKRPVENAENIIKLSEKREAPGLTEEGYEKIKEGRFKGLQEITKPKPNAKKRN